MPAFLQDYPLNSLNTFGVSAKASQYYEAKSLNELMNAVKLVPSNSPMLVLGGGSNILFTKDFNGTVIRPKILGIEEIYSDNNFVTLSVGAGEDWDEFVGKTVEMGLGGLENLSLIPGTVGASPIQNIGAYGVEAKDCIEWVVGLNLETLEMDKYTNPECNFGYRDSIFKCELKGKIIITHVCFKLAKNPALKTHYGNLEDELKKLGEKSLKSVRQAVINIRNAKLPDPKELGNAGSFFKNPVISVDLAKKLQNFYGTVPIYPVTEELVKLPAGWLIEKAGWKGKRIGKVGVHQHQALVLVNYGGAKGNDVLKLAKQIQDSVNEKFAIELEMEVNVI
ncbi:MAG TPA: UDP-N-acetylmuramate dehydrogenase [Tenuifilaceae bacterium]|mgnify:CR=1 FL=1|nr:UDP-N-acetylmuramate dehydrogenase [Tenuifilaceae bacterium]